MFKDILQLPLLNTNSLLSNIVLHKYEKPKERKYIVKQIKT